MTPTCDDRQQQLIDAWQDGYDIGLHAATCYRSRCDHTNPYQNPNESTAEAGRCVSTHSRPPSDSEVIAGIFLAEALRHIADINHARYDVTVRTVDLTPPDEDNTP